MNQHIRWKLLPLMINYSTRYMILCLLACTIYVWCVACVFNKEYFVGNEQIEAKSSLQPVLDTNMQHNWNMGVVAESGCRWRRKFEAGFWGAVDVKEMGFRLKEDRCQFDQCNDPTGKWYPLNIFCVISFKLHYESIKCLFLFSDESSRKQCVYLRK